MFVYEPKKTSEEDEISKGIYQLLEPSLLSLNISLAQFAQQQCAYEIERIESK